MKKTALTIAVTALLLTAAAPAWAHSWHRWPAVEVVLPLPGFVIVAPVVVAPPPRVIVVDQAPCYVYKPYHRPHHYKKRVHKRSVRHRRPHKRGGWVSIY